MAQKDPQFRAASPSHGDTGKAQSPGPGGVPKSSQQVVRPVQTFGLTSSAASGQLQTAPVSQSSTGAGQAPRKAQGASSKPALSHEQVSERAKAIWQAKGRPGGQDLQNWLEAEAQLKKELGLM